MSEKRHSTDFARLVSIVPSNRGIFLRGVLQFGLWSLYPIYTIIMLGKITHQFEQGTLDSLTRTIYWYGLGLIVLYIVIYLVRNIGWVELYQGYVRVLYHKYMQKFIYLDTNRIERIGTGRAISIIEKGINSRASFIAKGTEKVVSLIMTLGYFIYLLYQMGWWYPAAFFIVFTAVITYSYHLNKFVLTARQKRVNAGNEYTKNLVRIIMSKNEIMQVRNQEYEMNKLDIQSNIMIQANKGMNPYLHWMFYGPQIALDIMRIGVFLILGISYYEGAIDLTLLVTIGTAFILLHGVLDTYIEFFKDMTKEFDIVKKFRSLFDENKPNISYMHGIDFQYRKKGITINKITFTYGEYSNNISLLFDDFSLTISSGKKTALVGPSGGGKSTLIKLIAGYLQPDKGSIIVDEQALSTVNLLSYYKHVGYLTQEPSVFDGTIRENLEYGLDQSVIASEAKQSIETIIPLAKCERIYDLPHGLDTEIGERGVRLSGGQKQRLAIAKIMLKNPDIILLDEPTSALDSANEQAVTEALNNLFKDKTVIIIAHRLQTVKHADDIIYIADGKVIERGTHDELLALGGEYYKMVELQSGF